MSGTHTDLREIAQATSVLALDRYLMLGQERRVPTTSGHAAGDPLRRSVESEMYYRLYRRPGAGAFHGGAGSSVDTMRGFAAALSAANRGRGTWDPGWEVVGAADGDDLLVRRDGVRYRAERAEVRRDGDRAETCRVWVGKEMRQLSRGFYMALGDADWPLDLARPGALARCYWHVQAHVAPVFIAEVTGRLNARGVPFRTKVLQDPAVYHGADAGVLYVPSVHIGAVWPDIRAVYDAVRSGLRPTVPMFSHRLAPGLGYAEDPGDGSSFGQARCRLATTGLWAAFEADENDEAGRLSHLARAFAEADIDPSAPFRSKGGHCPPAPNAFTD